MSVHILIGVNSNKKVHKKGPPKFGGPFLKYLYFKVVFEDIFNCMLILSFINIIGSN